MDELVRFKVVAESNSMLCTVPNGKPLSIRLEWADIAILVFFCNRQDRVYRFSG